MKPSSTANRKELSVQRAAMQTANGNCSNKPSWFQPARRVGTILSCCITARARRETAPFALFVRSGANCSTTLRATRQPTVSPNALSHPGSCICRSVTCRIIGRSYSVARKRFSEHEHPFDRQMLSITTRNYIRKYTSQTRLISGARLALESVSGRN